MVSLKNDYENIDGLLETFVNWANHSSLEMGITLQMGGAIVSGTLISGKTYFQGVAYELKKQATGNLTATFIQNVMNDMSTDYVVTEKAEFLEPKFIHLREAKIFLSAPSNFNSDIQIRFWRGKLDCVEGFSLGAFGVISSNQAD